MIALTNIAWIKKMLVITKNGMNLGVVKVKAVASFSYRVIVLHFTVLSFTFTHWQNDIKTSSNFTLL